MQDDTVFALSSGGLPSGTAVIRISGPHATRVFPTMVRTVPAPRHAQLSNIYHFQTSEVLDKALVILFEDGRSFTGESTVEFHCHGGPATVEAVLFSLSEMPNFRPAEAGEFSRRAFENGLLDLTELEGLSDLITAQTEGQRRLALAQSSGSLKSLYEGWRSELIQQRAYIEAEFDFVDEDDVPGSVSEQVWSRIFALKNTIENHLHDNRRGEIVRDGFKIALIGAPNAGKSSLLNALARRDVAIVTDQPGTTRDVVEVQLNLSDQLVILSDTAGLRETSDVVEQEGIRRTRLKADEADLILWLQASDQAIVDCLFDRATRIWTKSDLMPPPTEHVYIAINTMSSNGLDDLLHFLQAQLKEHKLDQSDVLMTRERHRVALLEVVENLGQSLSPSQDSVVRSEHLRLAAESLGRVTGRIDVEDLLDVIFSEFCIGK